MSLLPPETSEERLKRMDFIEQTEADISGLKNLEALLSGELAKIRRKIHDRIGHLHKAASRGEPLPLFESNGDEINPNDFDAAAIANVADESWAMLPVDELLKHGATSQMVDALRDIGGLKILGALAYLESMNGGNLARGLSERKVFESSFLAQSTADSWKRCREALTGKANGTTSPEAARGSGGKSKRKQHA
jgi:hypothetical protein